MNLKGKDENVAGLVTSLLIIGHRNGAVTNSNLNQCDFVVRNAIVFTCRRAEQGEAECAVHHLGRPDSDGSVLLR